MNYFNILKYGVKGMKRGVRKPGAVSPSHAASHSQENPVHETFNAVGKTMGGHSFTHNVMLHKNPADAANHEGFVHGHLTDSGYAHKGTSTEGTITRSVYEHANGGTVLLNNGTSGGKSFLGYHYEPGEAKEAPAKAPAAAPASASDTPKAGLPAAAKSRDPNAIGADGKVDPTKFAKGIKRIEALTDQNYHGEALAHGAKLVGRQDIADKAKQINKEHMKAGGLTSELSARRNALHQELAEHAKTVLSPEQAQKLHMSY